MSIVACALKYIERKPITMRTMVNESKFCVDDHDGVVFVLAHLYRLPFQLRKWRISVGDIVASVYQVKSIVQRTGSSRAFMDIPIRIKVTFFFLFLCLNFQRVCICFFNHFLTLCCYFLIFPRLFLKTIQLLLKLQYHLL